MKEKVCCFTGHRPDAFPWKDNERDPRFHILLERMEAAIINALLLDAKKFICGNALGVDTWAAQIVLKRKQANPEIQLEIALPFYGHNSDSAVCEAIQKEADFVHVVSKAKSRTAAFFERDQYMVDNSDIIVAVYDDQTSKKSGTHRTMEMAKKKGLKLISVPIGDIDLRYQLEKISGDAAKEIAADVIIEEVAKYYSLNPAALKGRDRTKDLVLARHIAMYLVRELMNLTLFKTGRLFNGRDSHLTCEIIEKVEEMLHESVELTQTIHNIKSNIKARLVQGD